MPRSQTCRSSPPRTRRSSSRPRRAWGCSSVGTTARLGAVWSSSRTSPTNKPVDEVVLAGAL